MFISNVIYFSTLPMLFYFLSGCTIDRRPFSQSLQYALSQSSKQNSEYKVIQLQASKINGYNLLFMTGLNAYDPDMIDGYYIYHGKLITYFQTDSVDRTRIIDVNEMQHYNGKINGYVNLYQTKGVVEPIQQAYVITNEYKIHEVPKNFSLVSKSSYVDNNVIRNTKLKEYVYDYMENTPAVLYEIRFKQAFGKQYVIFRPMIFYDDLKCNGYFFWNGHLIVLYDINQSGDLLNRKGLVHSHRIPNYRSVSIKDWDFPYPIKLEIRDDKHLKELSLEEGFFL